MQYYFKPTALKGLKRLPKVIQRRIINKLDFFTKAANPLKFAEPIKDKKLGDYRFRIGDYRVIFDVASNTILITSTMPSTNKIAACRRFYFLPLYIK